jgi:hypothetical protein
MGRFLTIAAAAFLASFGAQASECAQPIYRGRINPANILTFWKDRTGTLELVQGNKKRSYNFHVSASSGYVTENLVISTDKEKLPSHTPNSRILFFGRNFSLAPKRGAAPFIVMSDLHQAFYHWAIQLSDDELGALLPDTAWKLVGCSKTEPKLYKPAQEARVAQDPLETWKRSTEAGQYWAELMAKVKSRDIGLTEAAKLHRQRFPEGTAAQSGQTAHRARRMQEGSSGICPRSKPRLPRDPFTSQNALRLIGAPGSRAVAGRTCRQRDRSFWMPSMRGRLLPSSS